MIFVFCLWEKQTNKQTKTWDPRSTHQKKFHNQQIPTRKNSKPTMVRWNETHETHTELSTLFACLWHTPYLLMAHSLLAYGTLLTRLCPRPTMTHDPMNSAQSYSRLIMRLFHLFHLNKFKDSLLSYFLTKGNLWKAHWGVSFKHPKL